MTHPIDIDCFIQKLREEYGINENAETVYRAYIPEINRSYQRGRDGAKGYPLVPAGELATFEAECGPLDDFSKRVITGFINQMNKAYAQGVEDAARG